MVGRITSIFPLEGYGFIQPNDGSALVVVDVANLGAQGWDVKPGSLVRFSSLQGVRGPKAYNVMILTADPGVSAIVRGTSDNVFGQSHNNGSWTHRAIHILSRSGYEDEIMRFSQQG